MRELISEARKVQLLVQLFNAINCWSVEGLKMVALVVGISQGYFAIRQRQNNLFLSAYCATVHVFDIAAYCGAFNRAYRLHESQKNLKRELEAACGKLSSQPDFKAEKDSLIATVHALCCPGLKVGHFHEMERESVLIFIDYVERQIISLLLAF